MLSAEDLGGYLLALLGGGAIGDSRVLSPASVQLAFQPQARVPAGGEYAFGWNVKPSNESFAIWHTGRTSSFHAHVAIDPATRRGFALLLNAQSYLSGPPIGKLGVELGRAASGEEPAAIGAPGIPLPLAGLMLFVALQALLCVRGVQALWRSRRAELQPVAPSLRALIAPILLAAVLTVSALVVFPRSNDLDWGGVMSAAPDLGALLLAVAVQAVLWAALRSIVWLRRRRGRHPQTWAPGESGAQ
jgi:CubicO group peptidase (beta-lactamase class C family)